MVFRPTHQLWGSQPASGHLTDVYNHSWAGTNFWNSLRQYSGTVTQRSKCLPSLAESETKVITIVGSRPFFSQRKWSCFDILDYSTLVNICRFSYNLTTRRFMMNSRQKNYNKPRKGWSKSFNELKERLMMNPKIIMHHLQIVGWKFLGDLVQH